MSSAPMLSVVMPVYNAQRYLALAVASVLAQSFSDFELIAVDDGSSDHSLRILRKLACQDGRIRVLSRPNTGVVGALNDGLAVAGGRWISRMDADDVAYPNRFARQLEFLETHPDHVAVGSAMLQIDPDGAPICVARWKSEFAEIDAGLLEGQGGLPHPTAMIRASALAQVGGYRAKYQWVEDKDLWLRLAEVGKLANLPEVLLAYRLHEASVCALRAAQQADLWPELVAETYARRGLVRPARIAALPVRGPSGRRDWITAAARSGYWATARKHAMILLRERPLWPSTWTTLVSATADALLPVLRRWSRGRPELPQPPSVMHPRSRRVA